MGIKKDINGKALIIDDLFIANNHRVARGESGEFEVLSDFYQATPDGKCYYNKKTAGIKLDEVEDVILRELGLSRLSAVDDDFI